MADRTDDGIYVPCPRCGELAELRGVSGKFPYLTTAGPMDSAHAVMNRVRHDGAFCDNCHIRFAPVAIHT